MLCIRSFLLMFLLTCGAVHAQYIRNGNATQDNCHCYTLTQASTFQAGSVWNSTKIDLTQSFDFWFTVYLGCLDADGADGMVFMLQPISTSVGTAGEGMGFSGVSPSVGIALDTYKNSNLNDPDFDHISIQVNGNGNHANDLAGPVPILDTSNNAEDCKWHRLRISWNANTKWLRAYVDNVLRVEKNIDLVPQIFNNNPMVYWGFSGATGGAVNVQKFCTALNPSFATNIPGNATCAGGTVQFTDASESFAPIARYYWNFGDGSTSAMQNPPPHHYTQPGYYDVRMVIEGLDGCLSDTFTRRITIGSVPAADFSVSRVCAPAVPSVQLLPANAGVSYAWTLNGNAYSNDSVPVLPGGTESGFLELTVHSLYGCGPDATAARSFAVDRQPRIDMEVTDGCVDSILHFQAQQIDNATQVVSWRWTYSNGATDTVQSPDVIFRSKDSYIVNVWGISGDGCSSDTLEKIIRINNAFAYAGRDTIILRGVPYSMVSGGTGRFLWQPATGLNNDTIASPVAILQNDQTYSLRVTSPEGCMATDSVRIQVFKGSSVFVPDAFTPNGDGLNDRFRPVLKGITRIEQFTVFNRWGEMVFDGKALDAYWDGRYKGQQAPGGNYVWIFRARDLEGKRYVLKGTVLLIR